MNGRAALHLVSAFATREKLVLAQEAVSAGGCEQTTIPRLLKRLAQKGQITGALVSIVSIRVCQEFGVWAGIIGDKETHYVTTQGAGDPG